MAGPSNRLYARFGKPYTEMPRAAWPCPNRYNDQGERIHPRNLEGDVMGQEFWLGATAGAVILAVLGAGVMVVTGGKPPGTGAKYAGRTLVPPPVQAESQPRLGLAP